MMKPTLLILFIIFNLSAFAQSDQYHFGMHSDALILLSKGEPADSVLQCLDGFLQHKREPASQNHFVDPEYAKADPGAFINFRYPEVENSEDNFYKPTVLVLLPIKKYDQYVIKIAYQGVTDDKQAKLSLVGTVVAQKKNGKFYIYNAIDYNTRNWNKRQVGSIKYIYPDKFDVASARRMNRINHELAQKFDTLVMPLTYYRCDDIEQLFKMMGFDYIPNMYISKSGGFAQYWNNTVLAGNNSELYVHEVTHFYLEKQFAGLTRIMDEGYGTFMGGSGGLTLKQLRQRVKEYIDEHPQADLIKVYTDFERMDESYIFTYVVSALICKDIESKYGFAKIKALFKAHSDADYFKTLQDITGVGKQQFSYYVKQLTNQID